MQGQGARGEDKTRTNHKPQSTKHKAQTTHLFVEQMFASQLPRFLSHSHLLEANRARFLPRVLCADDNDWQRINDRRGRSSVCSRVVQAREDLYEARHAEAEDGYDDNGGDAGQADLYVVDDQHRHAETINWRVLGMPTPEIVILCENPHVAHHEPNQPKGVDDVTNRVDVLELLRAFLEEILVSVHDEHHDEVCKHARRRQRRPVLPLVNILRIANSRLVPVLR